MSQDIVLVVACALVDQDGRVLLTRRPEGRDMAGLWEFPGGKVEVGEMPEDALARELDEELGIDVSRSCLAPFTFASHSYRSFHLLMPLWVCRKWQGEVVAKEGQELAWARPNRMNNFAMPPADVPLVALLRDFLQWGKMQVDRKVGIVFSYRTESGIHQDVLSRLGRGVKTRLKALTDFALDRSGASSIEYAIIAAGISVGMVTALNVAGAEVGATYQQIDDEYKKVVGNQHVKSLALLGGFTRGAAISQDLFNESVRTANGLKCHVWFSQ